MNPRALSIVVLCLRAAPMRFTSPMQPWTTPDGRVSLLRPAVARPSTSEEAISTLMSPGWRLVWGADENAHGRLIVRLVMKVSPDTGRGTASEVLQVGSSAASAAVRSCLSYGLDSGSGDRQPDRVINGVRYVVRSNGDAGMSSSIGGIDLRTVVGGVCYAIERYTVSESASAGDPAVTLPRRTGAAQLDASLASLRIGQGPASTRPCACRLAQSRDEARPQRSASFWRKNSAMTFHVSDVSDVHWLSPPRRE